MQSDNRRDQNRRHLMSLWCIYNNHKQKLDSDQYTNTLITPWCGITSHRSFPSFPWFCRFIYFRKIFFTQSPFNRKAPPGQSLHRKKPYITPILALIFRITPAQISCTQSSSISAQGRDSGIKRGEGEIDKNGIFPYLKAVLRMIRPRTSTSSAQRFIRPAGRMSMP
jgi:hypothetical protein